MKVPVASTSAIADVLALKGRSGWLTPPLQPVVAARCPVVGEAVTMQIERREPGQEPGPDFTPMYEVLSGDHEGKILVIAGATAVGGAVWGEILARSARQAGFAGVALDGFARDLGALQELALPIYAAGTAVVGPQGRAHVSAVNADVVINGTTVSPGDTIILDDSGCVRLASSDSSDVLAAAALYERAEEDVLVALAGGERIKSAYKHKSSAVARLKGQ